MRGGKRNAAIRILGCLLLVGVASRGETAIAESRSGASLVVVRVERHTGLYLPATDSSLALASFRERRLPTGPAAFGNSRPSLLVSGERPASMVSRTALTPYSNARSDQCWAYSAAMAVRCG